MRTALKYIEEELESARSSLKYKLSETEKARDRVNKLELIKNELEGDK